MEKERKKRLEDLKNNEFVEILISDKYDHFDYGMGEVECFLEKVKVIKRKENISFKRANGEKIRESYRTNGLHVVKIFELEEELL